MNYFTMLTNRSRFVRAFPLLDRLSNLSGNDMAKFCAYQAKNMSRGNVMRS